MVKASQQRALKSSTVPAIFYYFILIYRSDGLHGEGIHIFRSDWAVKYIIQPSSSYVVQGISRMLSRI